MLCVTSDHNYCSIILYDASEVTHSHGYITPVLKNFCWLQQSNGFSLLTGPSVPSYLPTFSSATLLPKVSVQLMPTFYWCHAWPTAALTLGSSFPEHCDCANLWPFKHLLNIHLFRIASMTGLMFPCYSLAHSSLLLVHYFWTQMCFRTGEMSVSLYQFSICETIVLKLNFKCSTILQWSGKTLVGEHTAPCHKAKKGPVELMPQLDPTHYWANGDNVMLVYSICISHLCRALDFVKTIQVI